MRIEQLRQNVWVCVCVFVEEAETKLKPDVRLTNMPEIKLFVSDLLDDGKGDGDGNIQHIHNKRCQQQIYFISPQQQLTVKEKLKMAARSGLTCLVNDFTALCLYYYFLLYIYRGCSVGGVCVCVLSALVKF